MTTAPSVRVVRPGANLGAPGRAELTLEGGASLSIDGRLPPDVPLGYHRLTGPDGGDPVALIVVPEACYWPAGLKTWGWAAQAYACRSLASWGIGDFADLRALASWSAGLGAGLLLVNPLGAALPVPDQEASPYFPASRVYRNPLYLRIEEVPGAAALGDSLEALARAGRALNGSRLIDRDAVFRLKTRALEEIWALGSSGSPSLAGFLEREGEMLRQFAIFCVLAERHGTGWPAWPGEYRHPNSPAVARFARDHQDRVGFHAWVQWLCDEQLHRAGQALGLVHDLPVGVSPDGADSWMWQDSLARDVTVGAPPDAFNPAGQNWGFPPFDPDRLAAVAYAPLVHTLRAAFRHARGLRIDHVMGLARLFWIPAGGSPADGRYVRYLLEDLLGIVALESQRAQAFVIGEDLGTVEPGFRERMAAAQVLSYRVLWFEPGPPSGFPEKAVASVTTHDLPTIAGVWSGADLESQRRLGFARDEAGARALRDRLQGALDLPTDAPLPAVIEATSRWLAEAPSAVVLGTLEDACAVVERPNVPGTHREVPNWSQALPWPLETLREAALPAAVAAALRRDDSTGAGGPP